MTLRNYPGPRNTDGSVDINIADETGNKLQLEPNGSLPVTLQDQTTPIVIVPLSKVSNTTTVLNVGVLGARTIDVTATTGFVDGSFIVIADIINNRYYVGQQVGAIATNTITLDTPLDFAYSAGATITNGNTNMAVNGSATTQIFGVRVSDPGLPLVVDITRIIFLCVTVSAADLSTFGDLPALTNGVVIRRRDGSFNNIFNAKTNGELASYMFDFTIHQATNPSQGQDGFVGRLTFAGQNKMGAVVRLGPDEDLECLIQDDLSALTFLCVIAEGSVVIE